MAGITNLLSSPEPKVFVVRSLFLNVSLNDVS